jgi:zinc protease
MKFTAWSCPAIVLGLLIGCQSATPIPKPAPAPTASVPPPPASYVPPKPFPKVQSFELENGLKVDFIQRHALPIVDIELLVDSGIAGEGQLAGAAKITPEWLEAGGAGPWNSQRLRETVDALGTSLDITVNRDSSRWSLAVTSDRLAPALDVLSALVQAPRFDASEYAKLRQRELERVRSLARTSGAWMAQMWLQRQLFRLPIGVHPYGSIDVLPTELERLDATQCREWFKRYVVPENARIVVVGEVKPELLRKEIERAFGRWKGAEAPAFNPTEPEDLNKFEIFVVDRPNSTQSDIFLALLGPNRRDPEFPEVAILQQIVGGGVAGRLFADVREKRSLAYSTSAGIQELAKAPSVLYFSAGTQTPKTAETVGALLEHLERLGKGAILPSELEDAQHFLIDSMPIRWEQVQSLAWQLTQLRTLQLPLDYYDVVRDRIGKASLEDVARVAAKLYHRERAIVVIAGDGNAIASTLTQFGPVTRVDPSQNFRLREQLTATP